MVDVKVIPNSLKKKIKEKLGLKRLTQKTLLKIVKGEIGIEDSLIEEVRKYVKNDMDNNLSSNISSESRRKRNRKSETESKNNKNNHKPTLYLYKQGNQLILEFEHSSILYSSPIVRIVESYFFVEKYLKGRDLIFYFQPPKRTNEVYIVSGDDISDKDVNNVWKMIQEYVRFNFSDSMKKELKMMKGERR